MTFHRVSLQTISDLRGSISVVHSGLETPFAIKRVYFLHGVPTGGARGGHAHRALEQAIIAVSGSFVLRLHDGKAWTDLAMTDPAEAVIIPPLMWRELDQFTEGAVCLVLASRPYEESDYIRDFNEFVSESSSH